MCPRSDRGLAGVKRTQEKRQGDVQNVIGLFHRHLRMHRPDEDAVSRRHLCQDIQEQVDRRVGNRSVRELCDAPPIWI